MYLPFGLGLGIADFRRSATALALVAIADVLRTLFGGLAVDTVGAWFGSTPWSESARQGAQFVLLLPPLAIVGVAVTGLIIASFFDRRLSPRRGRSARELVGAGVTVEYLTGLYVGRTRLQGESLAAPFINMAMEIEGTVEEIGRTYITFKEYGARGSFGPLMSFGRKSSRRLAVLVPGARLTIVGRIAAVQPESVQLADCEIAREWPCCAAPPDMSEGRRGGSARSRSRQCGSAGTR